MGGNIYPPNNYNTFVYQRPPNFIANHLYDEIWDLEKGIGENEFEADIEELVEQAGRLKQRVEKGCGDVYRVFWDNL